MSECHKTNISLDKTKAINGDLYFWVKTIIKRMIQVPYSNSSNLILLIMFCLTGLPLLFIIYSVFFLDGRFTLNIFSETIFSKRTLEITINTIRLGLTTTTICILIGVPLGYIMARYKFPYKNIIYMLLIFPFFFPPIINMFGWILLLGRQGYITNLAYNLFGLRLPSIYSLTGLVFVQSLNLSPFVFLLSYAAFSKIPDSFGESARIHGISSWRTLSRVIIPSILPSILGAALIVLMLSMEDVSAPAFLGAPAGFIVLTYEIYTNMRVMFDFEVASGLSFILLFICSFLVFLQTGYLSKKSFVVVSGRGEKIEPRPLGKFRFPIIAALVSFCIISFFLPLFAIAATSLSKTLSGGLNISNLSLKWYEYIFSYSLVMKGLWHSTLFAIIAATLCTFLVGLATSYIVAKTQYKFKNIIEFLSIVPLALPGLVLAVSLYIGWQFIYPPIITTMWVLVLAYTIRFLPFSFRANIASLQQISNALEESARISGISRLKCVKDIIIPLIKPGLLAAWIMTFTSAFRELTSSLILVTSETEVNATVLFQIIYEGQFNVAAAHSIIIMAVTMSTVLLATKLAGFTTFHIS